jgi:hypothetical protein
MDFFFTGADPLEKNLDPRLLPIQEIFTGGWGLPLLQLYLFVFI